LTLPERLVATRNEADFTGPATSNSLVKVPLLRSAPFGEVAQTGSARRLGVRRRQAMEALRIGRSAGGFMGSGRRFNVEVVP
jgi:hypothetical protein